MPPGDAARQTTEDNLSHEEMMRFVRTLQEEYDLRTVRVTGGDPLIRKDLESLVAMLAEAGIPDIAITTNGQALSSRTRALREAGLQRVNISLDSLDSATFMKLTGGCLKKTLEGIESALEHGLTPVKLNMVVLKGINDTEIESVIRFALARRCEVRFLELMPIGYGAARFGDWYVSSGEIRKRLQETHELSPLPTVSGCTCRSYLISNGKNEEGRIGFISPFSHPFCSGCRRLRLTADGRLLGCLTDEKGISIRNELRNHGPAGTDRLRNAISNAFRDKPVRRTFERRDNMATIGG